jgi:hypothetical protein
MRNTNKQLSVGRARNISRIRQKDDRQTVSISYVAFEPHSDRLSVGTDRRVL